MSVTARIQILYGGLTDFFIRLWFFETFLKEKMESQDLKRKIAEVLPDKIESRILSVEKLRTNEEENEQQCNDSEESLKKWKAEVATKAANKEEVISWIREFGGKGEVTQCAINHT